MDKMKPSIELQRQIQEYIDDPNTKVYINHNRDTGEWLFSISVEGTDDFWLDSFETEQEALNFIRDKKLKMA